MQEGVQEGEQEGEQCEQFRVVHCLSRQLHPHTPEQQPATLQPPATTCNHPNLSCLPAYAPTEEPANQQSPSPALLAG